MNRESYACNLNNVEVLDPLADVVITGDHLEGQNDESVREVFLTNSRTPFMIQQIFEKFPCITLLDIQNSHLESINLPDYVQLEILRVINNNISTLFNRTFFNQKQIDTIAANNLGLEEIEENTFEGAKSLNFIALVNNKITHIHPNTFRPLVNIRRINLNQNSLKRIDDIFFANKHLEGLMNFFLFFLHIYSYKFQLYN